VVGDVSVTTPAVVEAEVVPTAVLVALDCSTDVLVTVVEVDEAGGNRVTGTSAVVDDVSMRVVVDRPSGV